MESISQKNPVAYFCAEYGLESSLPFYAGGLGVLAGDTLKAAVDDKLPMVGIGLLYRGCDAKQVITQDGEQEEETIMVDPLTLGLEPVLLEGQPVFIKVHLTSVQVWLQCWQKKLSDTVTLYLLDSETEQNHYNERALTHSLYSGTEEWQFKQQLLLGIGGVKLLHTLGIHPAVYHVNEGRPAFLHWQLIRSYMDLHGMSFEEANAAAKEKTVYTNHTLVGAGNPGYPAGLLTTYGAYYADKMGVSVDRLVEDGIENGDTSHFQITRFALNTSRKANGVSALHSKLSAQQWPEYDWTSITNGVHMPTWQRSDIVTASSSVNWKVNVWNTHQFAKQELADFVHARSGFRYDHSKLVISWARRITGYKQLNSLFADVARLKAILGNTDRPVQLLVAGKAHFGDSASKSVLSDIMKIFGTELSGLALFVPDYNLELARYLVQGSDVWLNTPEYGKEASGTSGMKAMANGVLNCSVADGWVPELDWSNKGWIIDHTRISDSLYELLETQIVPEFYERQLLDSENSVAVPEAWVTKMRNGIEESGKFSAQRMLHQYKEELYGNTKI